MCFVKIWRKDLGAGGGEFFAMQKKMAVFL